MIAILLGMWWYIIVILICVFLIISNVEHLFIYLLSWSFEYIYENDIHFIGMNEKCLLENVYWTFLEMSISKIGKMSIQVLCPFFNQVSWVFAINYINYLYVFSINLLYDI